jgi:uncharacterized protein
MRSRVIAGLLFAFAWFATPLFAAAPAFQEIGWLALVPRDWKPQEKLDRKKAESLKDGDALAQEMMKELREVLDTAPTVPSLNGTRVRMPGFVVPLDTSREGFSEFLLVPYHGACIHTPPPPANQIVHVVSKQPVKGFQGMSAVWVSGTMQVVRKDTGMGVSGYALELAVIEPYRPK